MSKNYDLIATVDIDIAQPLVDDASFSNLLIVGPMPRTEPAKAPPKVGAYSSLNEVIEAGWAASGPDADPVGLAAKVAFSQSPTPSTIYIAPVQYNPDAETAQAQLAELDTIARATIGKDPDITGCTASYNSGEYTAVLKLSGPLADASKSGIYTFIDSAIAAGYTVKVGDTVITSSADIPNLPVYTQIGNLTQGDPAVNIYASFTGSTGVAAEFGLAAAYPTSMSDPVEYTGPALNIHSHDLENVALTLARAVETSGWYVACPAGIPDDQLEDAAAFIEATEKMMAYTEMGFFGTEPPTPTVGDVYFRTLGVYGRETSDQLDNDVPEANPYMNVAFVAKWLNYPSGSETSAFKRLASVYPSDLTTTEMKALAAANMNYFIKVGNANITMNGKVRAGEWADVIRFRDWLKNDMQVRVVNLFIVNPKVPYTDPGIALIQNAMLASLKSGQDAGGIAPEEFDEDGNLIPAYQTSVPLAASLSASQRASRKLLNCKFKARLAGAIHFAELKGSLTYEL